MLLTQTELDEVLAAYPSLSATGFVNTLEEEKPVDLGEVDLSVRWLDHHGRRSSINLQHSTYGLKHAVEDTATALRPGAVPYVSNGAFIAAAIYLGYRISRIPGTPNARINISYKVSAQARLLKKAKEIFE